MIKKKQNNIEIKNDKNSSGFNVNEKEKDIFKIDQYCVLA